MSALFPLGELLLYSCDLSLAVLSGFVFALFNLFIGHYLTVSVSNNGRPDHFALLQCVIHFVSVGIACFFLSILHHFSINTANQSVEVRLPTVYRRQLAIFVRDLTFLVASISIGCLSSLSLTIPVLVVPIVVIAWTTLFEKQKPPIVRGLFLAGPLCIFFVNLSLGGLYGTFLVDAKQLNQPGIIFTIVAGIGTSAIQFAKARAQFKPLSGNHHAPQLYVHDENLDKLEYEKNPVELYTTDETAKEDEAEKGQHWADDESDRRRKTRPTEVIRCWIGIQLSLLKKWPCQSAVGFFACLAHSFAYPVFTRLTGLFFSVFEQKMGKKDESLLGDVLWICSAYAIVGMIVFGAVTLWNTLFGKMGLQLSSIMDCLKFSLLISIASSLQNNRPMGLLAAAIFCCQLLLQHLACNYLNKSKNGRAIGFATTNGLQQLSQAMAYAGGFVLVKSELVSALNVFKIIQTMHLGSMGMTSAVLLANDFEKGSKKMAWLSANRKNTGKISPKKTEKY
ncbi:hypothetical protein niasHT_013518 [Heterodera trifolii]|uniref:Uncharacterized protein n=1 Tax=Heterodera trifolii TaxID=157864 RepID=A0ABD2LD36_9BILA